ncbi:unnamed protein product [Cylindrotheca closterium]|uniref:Uncharacterized protein n=1 Tax=Cylindrotheca closterium TaxID=2856 RepID=A0AAD2G8C1_9STRA|nr:unnamed protein product [Cylindrotheca closterium]
MDTSATVAASAAGVIVLGFWVAAVVYLFSYDKRDNGTTDSESKSHVYSWTFHVESLRFYGMLCFLVVLAAGALVTEKSGIDTIEDPTKTVIFELFGINHSCNWIDHNPVKMLAAMLFLPLVQIPWMLYTVFWHCRVAKSVKTGKVPKWLLNVSRILSPYNFIAMSQLHLWFVNNPNDTYGFTAHYIPYLMFQIAVCFIQLLNVLYLTYMGKLPWGVPTAVAGTYFALFTGTTILYAIFVITTIAGSPIIDATNSKGEELFTNILSLTWGALMVFGTLILSGKERLDGDNITLTIGDGMLQVESSSDEEIPTSSSR